MGKVSTKSKVGSLRQAQLLSVVKWRHWCARYFSSIYFAVRIFQNFTLNLLKCFSKFSDIFIQILWNTYRDPLEHFLKIFKIIPKNVDNISRHSRKYFQKFSEIFRSISRNFLKWWSKFFDLIIEIFRNISQNSPQ